MSNERLKALLSALSFKIIEHKLMYYYPDLVRDEFKTQLTISDQEYDELEKQYLILCRKLGHPNSLVHTRHTGFEDVKGQGMMELDFSRPSVQLVLKKYGNKITRKEFP